MFIFATSNAYLQTDVKSVGRDGLSANIQFVDIILLMLHFRMYYVIGWGVPVIMTTIWAVVTGLQIGSDVECWFGYSHIYSYFIVEGPRLTLITVSPRSAITESYQSLCHQILLFQINLLFLANIIRVLVTKLKNSNSSDTVKVR